MTDNIKPDHYRTGEIDLYEAWYQTYPFNEYRAIMQAVAERYMRRDKIDRVEDIGKAIYTLERLKEKEIEYREKQEKLKSNKTLKELFADMGKVFGGIDFDEWLRKQKYNEPTKIAGECLDEIYVNREDLLKRLLEEGYCYLARDEDDVLFAYEGAPLKMMGLGYWEVNLLFNNEYIGNDNFPEVKWTDEEPTSISDLLETHENGGENGK